MTPAVSIIIPTFNHQELVPRTLSSVFAQTFADHEVIVVNDGSPDRTADVVKPYADDGRICYIEQPNAGQAAARNRGLAEARGEFVAFLDDDDLWPTDKLAWQVEALRTFPEWAAVGGTSGDVGDDGPVYPPRSGFETRLLSTRDLFDGCPFISPGQVLIRTSAIRAVGGFDPTIWGADDYDLWFRLAASAPLASVDRCALFYRTHAGNASHDHGRMLGNLLVTLEKNVSRLPADERDSAERAAYRGLYWYMGRKIARSAIRAQPGSANTVRRLAAVMAGPLLRDRGLRAMVARDMLSLAMPAWCKMALKGLAGRIAVGRRRSGEQPLPSRV